MSTTVTPPSSYGSPRVVPCLCSLSTLGPHARRTGFDSSTAGGAGSRSERNGNLQKVVTVGLDPSRVTDPVLLIPRFQRLLCGASTLTPHLFTLGPTRSFIYYLSNRVFMLQISCCGPKGGGDWRGSTLQGTKNSYWKDWRGVCSCGWQCARECQLRRRRSPRVVHRSQARPRAGPIMLLGGHKLGQEGSTLATAVLTVFSS